VAVAPAGGSGGFPGGARPPGRRLPDERVRKRARILLEEVVAPAVLGPGHPLAIGAHHVDGEPVPYARAVAAPSRPFAVGDPWGPAWGTTWFRLSGRIPPDWAGAEVVLRFETTVRDTGEAGGEALVWRDGVPLQGLSPLRPFAPLTARARGGEAVELWVEAAANPTPPVRTSGPAWPLLLPDPGGRPGFRLARCELATFDPEVDGLAADLRVLLGLAADLPDAERRAEVHAALAAACAAVDPDDVAGTAAPARAALAPALAVPAPPGTPRVSAVGHAHLDTAWLWPAREAARKAARTLANVLALQERYPELHFVVSAARHLAWVEEGWPALFARVAERVREGRIEPVGGMWVEADCNIPSGESLVRQVVHGTRWFADRFGVEGRELWLPDCFGYPASLPQIMAEAGIDWFVSQKLSWNDTNRFPHHTFWWEGIDGTRVRAHFPPADTYNGEMTLADLRASAREDPSLYPFGFGDGGGGPTADMLEAARRVADLDGAPRVAVEPLSSFLAAADERAAAPAGLPVWAGELYLEKHRGIFTSQAGIKRRNRRNEARLQAAELWSAVRPDGAPYPADDLDRAWKLLLTNQFHDVLPGSSIRWVYLDAEIDHARVEAVASGIVDDALAAIAEAVDTAGMAEPVVVFNPTGFARREVVDAGGGRLRLVEVPPFGYRALDAAAVGGGPAGPAGPVEAGDGWVANEHLVVRWDGDGCLVSILDRDHRREVLAPGQRGNVFHLHHDRPEEWDAWDVDRAYLDGAETLGGPVEVGVDVVGGLRARVRFRRRFGRSALDQTMVLDAGSRRLDFVTDVEWHESHRFLKVAFPVDVRADRAGFEIQFGHVQRPTHENTSWEQARFEVCAHRWADLSEAGYGVALLNDCKYGYDVRGNVLRLSLLRAPSAPDPLCDRGHHRFTYSLLPHAGDLAAGGVVPAGYALNAPLDVRPVAAGPHAGPLPPSTSFLSVEGDGVVVETVKRADDGDGLVVRGYEAYGGRRSATLRLAVPVGRAVRTDLLERERASAAVEVDPDGGSVRLALRAFELFTLRLTPRPRT
jgi:alpha-mannosidase